MQSSFLQWSIGTHSEEAGKAYLLTMERSQFVVFETFGWVVLQQELLAAFFPPYTCYKLCFVKIFSGNITKTLFIA